jgi:hypothetical protein
MGATWIVDKIVLYTVQKSMTYIFKFLIYKLQKKKKTHEEFIIAWYYSPQ